MNDPQASELSVAGEATAEQKRLALSLISGCHVLNHLQYSVTTVLFPVMMGELGFGLLGLGVISALSSFVVPWFMIPSLTAGRRWPPS